MCACRCFLMCFPPHASLWGSVWDSVYIYSMCDSGEHDWRNLILNYPLYVCVGPCITHVAHEKRWMMMMNCMRTSGWPLIGFSAVVPPLGGLLLDFLQWVIFYWILCDSMCSKLLGRLQ